jgi:hypothetical protein
MSTTVKAAPVLNDTVIVIKNTWSLGDGGARTITDSTNVGTFPCSVQPQTSGTRGEGAHEGFDPAWERMTNLVTYQVHFALPNVPDGGLDPYDTLLWYDDLGIGHILTVTGFWPVGNQTGLFFAKATERT